MEDRCLFRGKRTDNGEWVQGCLITDETEDSKRFIGYVIGTDEDGIPHDLDVVQVEPSTICQCTGLKDENGELIWENDIVKINNSKVNTVIAFRDFEIICTIPNEKYYKHRLEYDTEYEVIGNTFDNPELLEVQP